MAARFWVGGTASWDASTTTHWSATSGGTGGASVPGTGDDVTFDASSNATSYTVTVVATANCNNITLGQPASGNLTFSGTSTLNVFGNYSLALGVLPATNGTLNFAATSGTKTITSNANTSGVGNVIFNGVGGTFQLVDNFIVNGNLTLTNGSFDATTNSKEVTLPGFATIQTITGSFTFFDLALTNGASALKTIQKNLANDITVNGTMTFTGNSAITHILIASSVVGTPRTITCNGTVTASNVDFMDITGAGSATWNLAGITGLSGDCGGNSGITLTTPTTQTWSGSSGNNWSLNAWTTHVPLPQDTAVLGVAFGTSQTVIFDMARAGTVDFTGATFTTALTFNWNATLCSLFGSFIGITGLTISNGNVVTTFAGRSAYNVHTFGADFQNGLTLNAPGGTLTFSDNFTSVTHTNRAIVVSNGTLDAATNNVNVTLATSQLVKGTINMGSGTWEFRTASGAPWTSSVAGNTVNAGTSTIKVTDTGAAGLTFSGGGYTFNNLWFSRGTSTASLTIAGSSTFNDFKDDGTGAHSLLFTTGTTQTVSTFTVSGGSGHAITINSTTTGTHSLVKSGGGTISCDWLNIQHSVATPGTTWYAGANSVNNQATATAGSGWIFTVPPTGTNSGFFFAAMR